jgi:hypothetical protein
MTRRAPPLLAMLLCVLGVGYAVYRLVAVSLVDTRAAALLILALAMLIVVFLRWGRRLMEWLKG